MVWLGLLGYLACQAEARAQDRGSNPLFPPPTVRDGAGMFSAAAVEQAKKALEAAEHRSKVTTNIETVDSLAGDKPIKEVATHNVELLPGWGVYVLFARENRRMEVLISSRYRKALGEGAEQQIRDAFLGPLREGKPDEALVAGVKTIDRLLSRITPAPAASSETDAHNGLIVRNQVRLTLAGARAIIAGAEAKAAEMGLKVNIAVVDDGGHMLSFARMDGARPASGYTATTKAITAATFRQESGPLPRGAATPDILLNLSLQNAAAASGGKLTTLHGGVPVVIDAQIIGGVGVGGGTGEQDAIISKAGIEAFRQQLEKGQTAAKTR
jgi:glc operon protein GlcG